MKFQCSNQMTVEQGEVRAPASGTSSLFHATVVTGGLPGTSTELRVSENTVLESMV